MLNEYELDLVERLNDTLRKLMVQIPAVAKEGFIEGVKLARNVDLVGLDCFALFEMSQTKKEIDKHE